MKPRTVQFSSVSLPPYRHKDMYIHGDKNRHNPVYVFRFMWQRVFKWACGHSQHFISVDVNSKHCSYAVCVLGYENWSFFKKKNRSEVFVKSGARETF